MKKATLKFKTSPFLNSKLLNTKLFNTKLLNTKLLNSKLLNSKGMSLIAVLVASAVGSVVVVGMTQYQTNLLNSINEIKQEGDLVILRAEIERKFFSKTKLGAYKVCTDTLKDFEDMPVPPEIPEEPEIPEDPDSPDNLADDSDAPSNRDRRSIKEEIIPEAIGDYEGFASPEGTPEPTETEPEVQAQGEATDTYELPTIYNIHYEEGQNIKSTNIKIHRIEAKLGEYEGDNKVQLYVYFASSKANRLNLPIARPLILNAEVNYQQPIAPPYKVESCSGGTSIAIDCLVTEGNDPYKTLVGCGSTKNNKGSHTVAIGYNAGSVNSTGVYNNFIGRQAGHSNTTGSSNNFIGFRAGHKNTIGGYNNFLGYLAGHDNSKGRSNNFLGIEVGYKNTTGYNNNFLGHRAGYENTTGHHNNFLGHQTGYNNTKFGRVTPFITGGYNNNFIGREAGYNNTDGVNNNFIGSRSGYSNTTGGSNNFIGNSSGRNNINGYENNFIGYLAGRHNTTGSSNNFIGHSAGYQNITGKYNNFIGREVGYENTTGVYNNFIGYYTGKKNTTGAYNNFIGYRAGHNNTDGDYNISMGYKAGHGNASGESNICIGSKACSDSTSRTGELKIQTSQTPNYNPDATSAPHSHHYATTGTFPVAPATSHSHSTSLKHKNYKNIAILDQDLLLKKESKLNKKPSYYFKKGSKLIEYDSNFNEVVALGNLAGSMNSGDKNVFVGSQSGQYNLIGEHNTFLGYNSGLYSRLGDYNTYIGAEAGASKKDSSSYPKKDKSYQLNLANTLYGNINKKPSYPFPIKDSSLVFDSSLTISKDLEVIGDIISKKDINILGNLKAKKANIKNTKLEKANIKKANIKKANIKKANIKYLEVDYLKVNNSQYIASYQNPLSSKQYKKNIESYEAYKESLNKILKIKLYNYNYKAKDHNPNKQRMGVISEYLDPVFQLKDNNINKNKKTKSIIMPDWPTIYGSLIASVKAIYSKLTNLIKDFQDFKKIISSQLDKTNKELSDTNKELLKLKQEMLELKKQIKASR